MLSYYDYECVTRNVRQQALLNPLGKELSEDTYFFGLMSFGTNGWKNIYVAFEKAAVICGEFLPAECKI